MNSPLVAGIVGVIGATAVCLFLARYLRALSNEIHIGWFLLVCVIGLAICFAIAWWMDKRDLARKAHDKSGQP